MSDKTNAIVHAGVAAVLLLSAIGFMPGFIAALAALVGAGASGVMVYNKMWR